MRLIDADKLEKEWTIASPEPYNTDAVEVLDSIREAPTVDAVPVVRCKNCANFRQNASGVCWCDEYGGAITPNDYCSRAETDKQPRASIPWEAD